MHEKRKKEERLRAILIHINTKYAALLTLRLSTLFAIILIGSHQIITSHPMHWLGSRGDEPPRRRATERDAREASPLH